MHSCPLHKPYWPNANETVFLQKSVFAQLAKKFPASYETQIHYCAFKNLPLVILSQMNPVHLLTPLLTDDLPTYV